MSTNPFFLHLCLSSSSACLVLSFLFDSLKSLPICMKCIHICPQVLQCWWPNPFSTPVILPLTGVIKNVQLPALVISFCMRCRGRGSSHCFPSNTFPCLLALKTSQKYVRDRAEAVRTQCALAVLNSDRFFSNPLPAGVNYISPTAITILQRLEAGWRIRKAAIQMH